MANKKLATVFIVVLITIMISMALISYARPVADIDVATHPDINLNVSRAIHRRVGGRRHRDAGIPGRHYL